MTAKQFIEGKLLPELERKQADFRDLVTKFNYDIDKGYANALRQVENFINAHRSEWEGGMMTKHFYRDPLEAAYMGKHHGMKFIIPDDCGLNDGHIPITYLYEEYDIQPPYYVAPDSLPLLQPQKGDLVEFSDIADVPVYGRNKEGEPYILYYKTEISPSDRLMVLNEHFTGGRYKKMRQIILMRSGKHFFWPEVE